MDPGIWPYLVPHGPGGEVGDDACRLVVVAQLDLAFCNPDRSWLPMPASSSRSQPQM
jgi:hypothetical protein